METAVDISWKTASTDQHPDFFVLRKAAEANVFDRLHGTVDHAGDGAFRYRNGDVEPGRSYVYRITVLEDGAERILFETDAVRIPLPPLALHQNYPNPFNPVTAIQYYLPRDGEVTLAVYDAAGRRVALLEQGARAAGKHTVRWDGRDRSGNAAASGIYFYRITFGKESITRKMVLMR